MYSRGWGIVVLISLAAVGCNLDLGMGGSSSQQAPQAVNDTATTAEDTSVTIAVLANDTDPGGRTLTVKAVSQPDHGRVVINPDQTVTYTPTANFNGGDSFAYTVSNGQSEGGAEVTIDVLVNHKPTLSTIANQTIYEDTTTGPIPFTIGDVETPANALTVTASSNNSALIPNANLVLGGSGANRTITATPMANANGSAVITVSVSDGSAATNTSFTVTVVIPNHAPLRTAGSVNNLTVAVFSGITSLGLNGLAYSPGPPGESNQTLIYTVTQVPGAKLGNIVLADNETIVSAGSSYSLEQLQGMQFSTAIGSVAAGSGLFRFNVTDNGGTANGGSDTLTESLTVAVFVPLPRTGQTTCYDQNGTQITCAGTGQDGDKQAGVIWPTPRFVDNYDGTVTDKLTGLVWLKKANCFLNKVDWQTALNKANSLANGQCDLQDGSAAGQWRLPNRRELFSLGDLQQYNPALSNAAGTSQWTEHDAFSGVQSAGYWSSVSDTAHPAQAVATNLTNISFFTDNKTQVYYVWPVRDGLPGTVPAPVPRTGQTTCYDQNGTPIPCAGTGQDGDKQAGVAWPNPRFTDNGDGTVTDQLTALIWLKKANCFLNKVDWQTALDAANKLANGVCGLKDGSAMGQWRLPNTRELESLIDYEYTNPALSNTAGTGQWTKDNVFSDVQSAYYWISTSAIGNPASAWLADFSRTGIPINNSNKIDGKNYVWPVRGGQ